MFPWEKMNRRRKWVAIDLLATPGSDDLEDHRTRKRLNKETFRTAFDLFGYQFLYESRTVNNKE